MHRLDVIGQQSIMLFGYKTSDRLCHEYFVFLCHPVLPQAVGTGVVTGTKAVGTGVVNTGKAVGSGKVARTHSPACDTINYQSHCWTKPWFILIIQMYWRSSRTVDTVVLTSVHGTGSVTITPKYSIEDSTFKTTF